MVGAVQGVERGAGGDQRGWEKGGAQESDWFQGQYWDEETGLHYNRYRYYDPYSARFASSDPIALAGGTNLHAYAPNAIEWIDPLGLSFVGKNPAQRLADKAQSLTADKRPNTVAVIRTPDGRVIVGRNQGGVRNKQVQSALEEISPNQFNGECAEVNAISRALNKGVDLTGATISVANVRGRNSVSGIHGSNKPPCCVCNPLVRKFGLKVER